MFSYPLLHGEKSEVFINRNVIVISKELAIKMFSTVSQSVGRSLERQLLNFKGEEVSVEEATIKKTGSGQTQIGAVESLNVRATGSEKVYYSGNPERRNISSTGSAKLIRR